MYFFNVDVYTLVGRMVLRVSKPVADPELFCFREGIYDMMLRCRAGQCSYCTTSFFNFQKHASRCCFAGGEGNATEHGGKTTGQYGKLSSFQSSYVPGVGTKAECEDSSMSGQIVNNDINRAKTMVYIQSTFQCLLPKLLRYL